MDFVQLLSHTFQKELHLDDVEFMNLLTKDVRKACNWVRLEDCCWSVDEEERKLSGKKGSLCRCGPLGTNFLLELPHDTIELWANQKQERVAITKITITAKLQFNQQ